MKKKESDAIVGIVIFVAILTLVSGVIWLKKISLTRKAVSYTAIFPKIGGLNVGDPVRVNGVDKGSVSKIYIKDDQVAVQFKIDKSILFTDSSKITVANVGLMGERALEITLSRMGNLYSPDESDTPSVYIKGKYDSGISEAIGMLGNIMNNASGLIDTVQYVLSSTLSNRRFINFFDRAVKRVDSILLVTNRTISTNENRINNIVLDLNSASNNIDHLLDKNKNDISTIIVNTKDITDSTKYLVSSIDSILVSISEITEKANNGDGTIGQLLNNDTLMTQVDSMIVKLNSLLAVADEQGLKLRIKLGFKDKKKAEKEVTSDEN